jgi:hypothetical protein
MPSLKEKVINFLETIIGTKEAREALEKDPELKKAIDARRKQGPGLWQGDIGEEENPGPSPKKKSKSILGF